MAVWDRIPDEPEESYARFLIYRGLGPLRTIADAEHLMAGGKGKKKRPSGAWCEDSSTWNWRSRATSWDVSQLQANGERLGYVFIGVLEKMAEQLAAAVASGKHSPKSSRDVIEWLKTLSPYLTPQLIDKIRAKPPGTDPLPAEGDGSNSSSE